MLRNRVFLFQAPLTKQEKASAVKTFEDKVQVIVYGSNTKNVIDALKKDQLSIADNSDRYSFQYNASGKIDIHADVEVTSDVNYKEVRKKKNKEQNFAHDDVVHKNLHSGRSTTITYNSCAVDFPSNLDTFIVIAANDIAESERMIEKVQQTLGEHKVKDFIILQYPENGRTEMPFREKLNHITYVIAGNENNFKRLAESIEEKLDKHTKDHVKGLEQAVVDELHDKIVKTFEDTAHKKADKHFAEHKRCRIM